jgi:hypothetical protein
MSTDLKIKANAFEPPKETLAPRMPAQHSGLRGQMEMQGLREGIILIQRLRKLWHRMRGYHFASCATIIRLSIWIANCGRPDDQQCLLRQVCSCGDEHDTEVVDSGQAYFPYSPTWPAKEAA